MKREDLSAKPTAQADEVPMWATLQAWEEATDDTPRSVIRDRARELAAAASRVRQVGA